MIQLLCTHTKLCRKPSHKQNCNMWGLFFRKKWVKKWLESPHTHTKCQFCVCVRLSKSFFRSFFSEKQRPHIQHTISKQKIVLHLQNDKRSHNKSEITLKNGGQMWLEITCLNLVTIFNILIENFEKISKRVRLIETVRLIEKILFFEIVVYV